jgi:hypothetical protein
MAMTNEMRSTNGAPRFSAYQPSVISKEYQPHTDSVSFAAFCLYLVFTLPIQATALTFAEAAIPAIGAMHRQAPDALPQGFQLCDFQELKSD